MRSHRHSRGDELLLAALAHGRPVEDAAKAAAVSERTVYRRLADPAFRARLTTVRDELIAEALGELAGSASDAARTLRRLLAADNDHVQLRAARAILEQLLRLREAVDIAERVAKLERTVNRPGRRSR